MQWLLTTLEQQCGLKKPYLAFQNKLIDSFAEYCQEFQAGGRALAEYLVKAGYLTSASDKALKKLADEGQLDVLKWLVDNSLRGGSEVADIVRNHCRLQLGHSAQAWLDYGCQPVEERAEEAQVPSTRSTTPRS